MITLVIMLASVLAGEILKNLVDVFVKKNAKEKAESAVRMGINLCCLPGILCSVLVKVGGRILIFILC